MANPQQEAPHLQAEPTMYLKPQTDSDSTRAHDNQQASSGSSNSEEDTLAPSRALSTVNAEDSQRKAKSDGSPPAQRPRTLSRRSSEFMSREDLGELTRQLSRHLSRTDTNGSAINPDSENFELEAFLAKMFRRSDEGGVVHRELNVVFENLSVEGIGSGVSYGETVASMLLMPIEIIKNLRNKPVKHILQNFTGSVSPGEMLLVLGRPGSGCSSLLKTLANNTGSFSNVSGDRSYGGISPKEMSTHFAGDLAYLPEDDIHLPVLTVDQTLQFATAARAPASEQRLGTRDEYIKTFKAVLLAILGLRHTVNTKVGGDYVRGISGGQRKRVSIAELFSTGCKAAFHDNSTRGLDASTSLEYVQALRIMSDITRVTTVVSIYQCGEQLFELFDKVCLIYEGRQIYYGPQDKALEYFRSLGYEPQPRQTTPDFLCAVTDPNARVPIADFQGYRPKTADEFAKAWTGSELGKLNVKQTAEAKASVSDSHLEHYRHSARRDAGLAKKDPNSKAAKRGNPYVISYWMQTKLSMRRRLQLAWGDKPTLVIPIVATVIQGLLTGSTFFQIPDTTAGFFSRGGVLFFSILFNAFQAMAEITVSYTQRPVIVRQRRYAMVHPSCDALAQTLVDLPIKFVVVLIFDIILYFMTALSTRLPSQFFVFLLFTYVVTLAMIAFFRMLAAITRAESSATMFAGLGILVFVIYAGYVIPRPQMKVWFRWISYAHPISFGFEALLTNELRASTNTPCANLIPNYAPSVANQVCAIAGSVPGQATIDANRYLAINNGYYYSNTWRNFGIIMGFWIFFLVVQYIATEYQEDVSAKPAVIVYRRGHAPESVKQIINAGSADEEKLSRDPGALIGDAKKQDDKKQDAAADKLQSSSDVYSFKNICYEVPTKDGMTRLLDNVSGYVAPGKLTALMGESGAGKTTLLNVLAQRVTTGVVTGDMLVNAKPLPLSFQRQTGYCQQQDVHLATQTVREALEFSAILRQPASIPKAEKFAYVDSVIEMLEMETFQDALVGEVGEGLNVEQRKRLTIGVELAAKPALLLFADEPTSGLDSQSAWSVVQFLRKLADHGQAVLCTIHQPSSELFQVFDRLLLLKKGGKTVYFGDIGENSSTLLEYFERNSGRECGDRGNPAEFILDCVGAGANAKVSQDWGQLWNGSNERKESDSYIAKLEHDFQGKTSQADDSPDAGRQYAAPIMTQLTTVIGRTFQNYWRDPVYVWSKLALNILAGLFIGFSFWMAPTNQQGLQVFLFSVFMAIVLAGSLAQQIQPKFISLRSLYEVRERPSRMYNSFVQVFASVIVEIPWNIFAGTLFWACWYFTIGGQSGGRAIYAWVTYAIAFELYWQTFAQAVAALSPNGMIASVIFSLLFSFVIVFNGVLQPPALLPYFWRSWMFPLTPFRYLVAGLLADLLGEVPLTCTPEQLNFVTPPAGAGTCQDYLGQFIAESTGFISNPDATGVDCGYCQYSNGSQYLSVVEASFDQRWRNFGILFAYVAFNLFCTFAFNYLFRLKDWSRKSKASNPKAAKKAAPEPVEHAYEKTEERNQSTGTTAPTAFNPQMPGAGQGNTATST